MRRHSPGARRRATSRRLVGGLLLLLLLSAGWLGMRGLQVRSSLVDARQGLTTAVAGLEDGEVDGLSTAQQDASDDVGTAVRAVQDPLWRLASGLPVLGRTFAVTRDAALVAQEVVDGVLPPLLRSGDELSGGKLLDAGRVDLAQLTRISADVTQAQTSALEAQALASQMPQGRVPAPVADARRELTDQVGQLTTALESAATALQLAPPMLGAQEPRRYFVAVQNNAETRGPGGLVGAYAVVRADRGQLSLERSGTNQDFVNAPAPVLDLGPEFAERYDKYAARTFWSNATTTPDWPSAAALMAALWEAQGEGRIDGVVGVDPLAMAEILAVTGPAQVAGRQIGGDNVADFVMRDEYALFPQDENAERKDVLGDLATVLYEKVSAGGYSAPDMLAALGRAAGAGHVQLWQSRPEEQALIQPLRIGAALPRTPGAYLQVVSNNGGGNKADYYVRRRVSYERTAPGEATATVVLSNTVVASAVPPVVTLRVDKPDYPVEPGQTRQLLSVYVGFGQYVRRVLVDGVEVPADLGTEAGHGVASVFVEIRPSRPTTVTVEMSDPGGALTYRQQPLVVDDELDLLAPIGE